MIRRLLCIAVILIGCPSRGVAQDAANALDQARAAIGVRQYREAVEILDRSVADIERIADPDQRVMARAAFHFYTAVASSAMEADARAEAELRSYFRLTPKAKRIDSKRYAPRFVKLFSDIISVAAGGPDTFAATYPGFATFRNDSRADDVAGAWVVLDILGSKQNKRDFSAVMPEPGRLAFLEEFWKRHDRIAETPRNEFRDDFFRRLAFADQVFSARDLRGALSDRGRVFVLLGEPSFVRRRPITDRDRVQVAEDAMINGTIEQWVYKREQLALAISKPSVTYRFVTQQGIGVGVLQREDAHAMQALTAAMNPPPAP